MESFIFLCSVYGKIWVRENPYSGIYNAVIDTAWKVSKYGDFSGPYFPVFGPEKTPYLDTFHAVIEKRTLASAFP